MKVRPACPICVTRYCANCFYRDQAVNRLWINKYLPGGECRRCGAVREAVTEKPVRHTSKTKHQEHVNEYARILLTKPPKLIDDSNARRAVSISASDGLVISGPPAEIRPKRY